MPSIFSLTLTFPASNKLRHSSIESLSMPFVEEDILSLLSHILLGVALPFLISASSITSSWSKLALCMISTEDARYIRCLESISLPYKSPLTPAT